MLVNVTMSPWPTTTDLLNRITDSFEAVANEEVKVSKRLTRLKIHNLNIGLGLHRAKHRRPCFAPLRHARDRQTPLSLPAEVPHG